jgi:phage terminase Nu1 subunit (DNA packaging protein)
MKNVTELADRNILEYETHQQQSAELLARARKHIASGPEHDEVRVKMERLAREHDRLSANLDELKRRRASGDLLEDDIERAGPMAVWEVLGQDLEQLVEKLTNH